MIMTLFPFRIKEIRRKGEKKRKRFASSLQKGKEVARKKQTKIFRVILKREEDAG